MFAFRRANRYHIARGLARKINYKQSGKQYQQNSFLWVAAGFTTVSLTALFSTTPTLCEKEDHKAGELYPPIQPYLSKLLKVSELHSINYEVYGNPNGKPVLFVHGGPGGGTNPAVRIYLILSHQY